MKPIRLPEPPASPRAMGGVPDIFEGGVHGVIRRAVIIGNGFPASENQSIGLVQALGLSDKHTLYVKEGLENQNFAYGKWWLYVLVIYFEVDVKSIVRMARETFEKDGPLLVIASGRDTISITGSIKRLASDNVFVVQIQHPRSRLDRFDLVITPKHDYYPLTPQGKEQVPHFLHKWITPHEPPDKHVVLTVGALHQVDFAALRTAAITWHEEFAPLPKPLLVVNIGGPTRYCRYGADLVKQLTASLHNVLASCGSVRISFSRRTPEKHSKIVVKELGMDPKVHIWNGEEPNPHMGHLAWADAFVITADSVSMLSEACSTGKPVYVVGAERCTWKFTDFHKALGQRGMTKPFTGLEDMSESWSYPPLNDTAIAATRVNEALAEKGWKIKA
ncbi:serine/threonine protein kinase [Datura stramonium]|uniref:Serine/threonine protein kinase n=1 Tax=Datura stramonium TaxID=4076 RepID=A0ABS8T8M3_DATST|nr:serine/threonine protein kinase [Datura stramonium]